VTDVVTPAVMNELLCGTFEIDDAFPANAQIALARFAG
jgi:hypothetical protein